MEGVEPTCLAALDPKSSASANFATSAIKGGEGREFLLINHTKIRFTKFLPAMSGKNFFHPPVLCRGLGNCLPGGYNTYGW